MEMSIAYISMYERIQLPPNSDVYVKDIAHLIVDEKNKRQIEEIILYQLSSRDKSHVILDVVQVIKAIKKVKEDIEISVIGASETIIEIQYEKKGVNVFFFILVWMLLFTGSALAIMYFHEDVSMGPVQEKLYYILTGQKVKQPLLFQVPYSIGLGLGMILFFNHVFKNRINEEPSPLELEMHQYQRSIDNYLIHYESKDSRKNGDDT
ncbi:MAG: stage V sporulation protein AA [Bacillaceae bacterium]